MNQFTKFFSKYCTLRWVFAAALLVGGALAACSASGHQGGAEMKPITVGDVAPDFSLPDQNGEIQSIGQFRGTKNVVLYFYPKDNTSG